MRWTFDGWTHPSYQAIFTDCRRSICCSVEPVTSADIIDSDDARAYRTDLVQELSTEIRDDRVLSVMANLPRHFFVPEVPLSVAYLNEPVPIGYGQTISQPFIVAAMTEALELRGHERVLEVGTGSGYQTAVLSALAAAVYSIEVVPALAEEARRRLARLGCANVLVRSPSATERDGTACSRGTKMLTLPDEGLIVPTQATSRTNA